ncbi:MAG TPA: hypothetical protein VGX94_12285 [Terriglobia bacterium]|nr:hypothetical protein [Terriglobia bacterium]
MENMTARGLIVYLCAIGIGISAPVLTGRGQLRKTIPASAAIASVPPATVDKGAYNAKMLALANLPPRSANCAASASGALAEAAPKGPRTASLKPASFITKRAAPRPCPPALWPVHTAYPDAGALLPFKRIVAYYGNFYSPRMGVLGEYPPDKVRAMLEAAAAAWAKADPSTPVVPALDYIVVAAQQVPGRDGMYRMRMPPGQIEKAITMADQTQGLLFLDVQPGWSTVEIEVPRLAEYLKLPNVELALDPEFALTESKRPGAWRGTMNASDINFAAHFLAKIVQQNNLPPKVLVVHRFTQRMVTDFRAIKPLPEVEIVMDMDGFGSPALKHAAYRDFIANQPVQFSGFKLFYKNDVKWGGRLMTPEQVLRLSPQPIYIVYQ